MGPPLGRGQRPAVVGEALSLTRPSSIPEAHHENNATAPERGCIVGEVIA